MSIALATTLTDTDFAVAIERTKAALAEQGFGVLTEIDVQATLKAKLGTETEPYLIIGSCNPGLAHQALGVDPQVGLLLPCNVVVRTDTSDSTGRTVIVEAMNPDIMVTVTGRPELEPIATNATKLLTQAIDTLNANNGG